MPQGRYSDVIAKLKPEAARSGEIVHLDGRVLGRHDGILRFTVGQRRGLSVAAGEPLYVVHLDAADARVVVGPRSALDTRRIGLRQRELAGRRSARGDRPNGHRALCPGALDAAAAAGGAQLGATARPPSISPRAKAASPPGRPASSTTAAAMMPGCSAEALSQRSSAHRRPKRCCRGCAPPDRCKRRARGSSPRAVRRAEPDCIGNCRAGRDWQGHDRSRPAKPAGRYLRPQTDCGPRKRSRAKYSEAQRNCRAQRNRRRERPAQRKRRDHSQRLPVKSAACSGVSPQSGNIRQASGLTARSRAPARIHRGPSRAAASLRLPWRAIEGLSGLHGSIGAPSAFATATGGPVGSRSRQATAETGPFIDRDGPQDWSLGSVP